MYAHQVIEDFRQRDDLEFNKTAELVEQSQKFHFGKAEDNPYNLFKIFGKGAAILPVVSNHPLPSSPVSKQTIIFYINTEFVKLPYKLIWVDYIGASAFGDQMIKTGLLCQESENEHVKILFCQHYRPKNIWQLYPVIVRLKLGEDYSTDESGGLEIVPEWTRTLSDPIGGNYNIAVNTLRLLSFLGLLCCKNILIEQHNPDAKLQKARKKRGKLPLFSYHTLVIKPTGKRQESIPRNLWDNRVHLCRGHFKTYTEDKPLFGHITGRFWWQPTVRGRNREGVVMKDYELRTA